MPSRAGLLATPAVSTDSKVSRLFLGGHSPLWPRDPNESYSPETSGVPISFPFHGDLLQSRLQLEATAPVFLVFNVAQIHVCVTGEKLAGNEIEGDICYGFPEQKHGTQTDS